jgi:GDP-4-dehydro-6-deoxy-D-mannose reductase
LRFELKLKTQHSKLKTVMRNLVTGVTGFAGGHLAEALLARGESVVGVSRRAAWPPEWRHLAGGVDLRAGDVGDRAVIESLLREVQPERIYHLAGYAQTGRSFREPDAAWAGNLGATRALYDAVLRWGGLPRILFVGSGLVYGDAATPGQMLDETCLLGPISPYAASKAAADLLSYQVARASGLDVVRARPFNHIGPAQSPEFAVAHFCKQVTAIGLGQAPPVLETGDLAPRRDLTDVRDVIRAYTLLMEKGRAGEAYNIGTGRTHAMQEVVDRLLAVSGVRVEVRQRADLVRVADTAAVRADAGKLQRETGWAPALALDRTLRDTLDYWKQQLA